MMEWQKEVRKLVQILKFLFLFLFLLNFYNFAYNFFRFSLFKVKVSYLAIFFNILYYPKLIIAIWRRYSMEEDPRHAKSMPLIFPFRMSSQINNS